MTEKLLRQSLELLVGQCFHDSLFIRCALAGSDVDKDISPVTTALRQFRCHIGMKVLPSPPMSEAKIIVALISDVFYDNDPAQRLQDRLGEAKQLGANLAVLPEIPLNPWAPATKESRDDDAEAPGGERHVIQSDAAKSAAIALIGGVIIKDPKTNLRYNTALAFDSEGNLRGTHQKWHIPEEPGFWESSHYEAGVKELSVVEGLGIPIGMQICSDINRPQGCHLLGAMGAQLIVAPRSCELATYQKWRPVFQSNAVTSCVYLVSANRPAPEQGVLIGGPSIAIAPNGEVILESTDPVSVVEIDPAQVLKARTDYPGYLSIRSDLYARTWAEITPKN